MRAPPIKVRRCAAFTDEQPGHASYSLSRPALVWLCEGQGCRAGCNTEFDIKRERVTDSIAERREAAKDLGGRPQLITDSHIRNARRLIDAGETVTTVSRDLGMSCATFYRRTQALDVAAESSEVSERAR